MVKIDGKNTSRYAEVINSFIGRLNSQMESVPTLNNILSAQVVENANRLKDFISKHGSEEKDEEGRDMVRMPLDYARAFERLNNNMETSIQALENVGRNAVVAMVSMYDAFLGSLVNVVYEDKPQLIRQSQKEFKLNSILNYSDFEELKQAAIEEEIENLLRKSHIEQLSWIETKLDLEVKDFKAYPDFIELMERRNLFVHADGIVSRHYIDICSKYNISMDAENKLGYQLNASLDYVHKSYEVLFQTGVMLGFVIWHKIRESEGEELIEELSDVCYNLINEGHYDLAQVMIEFALDNKSFKKHIDQAQHHVFMVNKALAYHLQGKKDDCAEIVCNMDLSASKPVYHLAAAVLKENYEEALKHMDEIGKDTEMRSYYKEWPLFKRFRETDIFKSKYKELYGEDYICLEAKKPKFEDIIASAEKMMEKSDDNLNYVEEENELTMQEAEKA